ncbi:MAG: extracellular solute-binding protein [Oscillospiraceae bacterium]|nr:extracellular solute-binding protein [Oscillospiraceae bacterium]
MKKIAALVVAAAVSLCAVSSNSFIYSARASENGTGDAVEEINFSVKALSAENSYERYLARHAEANYPSESVSIPIDRFTAAGSAECAVSADADTFGMLSWQGTGTVSWDVSVRSEGFYCFEMSYFSISENNSYVSFGVGIDGEYPFDEAREIRFYRYWKNKTSIRLDGEYKNQLLPELVKYDTSITSKARSSTISDGPLWFYLSRGEHTLTLYGVSTDFFISSLRFCPNTENVSYSEIRPTAEQLSDTPALIDGTAILVEAEMPKYTNSVVLRPTSEPSDSAVSPSHPTYTRYNTIGADSWNTAGQTLFYEVSAPNEGYYALNIKCRVNVGSGLPLYRRISVNGTVPCEELNAVEIPFSSDWQNVSPRTDTDELIFIHLNAGKNTIAFEAVNGKAGDALNTLEKLVLEIMNLADGGEIYGHFGYYGSEVESVKNAIEHASGGQINDSELEILAKLLKGYEEKEPSDLIDLRKCLSSVYEWIGVNKSSYVEADYFELKTVHEEFRGLSRGFFKQLWFGWLRFWGSFFRDSQADRGRTISVVSDIGDAEILNSLLGDYQGDILISEGTENLLETAVSHRAPDVALFVDEDKIYELVKRGRVLNLTSLSDYDTVNNRSPVGVTRLYEYNGGVYGIPLISSFPMMFCRTDILEELGLSVPETWDELEDMLPALKEHGLCAGLGDPSDFSAGNAFMIMLSQSGKRYENGAVPDLSDAYVKSAFVRYASFYTEYGCPEDYDALRMFKSGRMPIVIADYSRFYGELSDMTEIRGLWSVSHVPGTLRTDSNGNEFLDYSTNTNSLGAVIFADSRNISAAWEFIRWFTQPEIQTRFGVMREAASSGIYATSNIAVISNLRQSPAEYRRFGAQASRINEISKSPSLSLFYSGVYSAYTEAREDRLTAAEAATRYAKLIKDGLSRK